MTILRCDFPFVGEVISLFELISRGFWRFSRVLTSRDEIYNISLGLGISTGSGLGLGMGKICVEAKQPVWEKCRGFLRWIFMAWVMKISWPFRDWPLFTFLPLVPIPYQTGIASPVIWFGAFGYFALKKSWFRLFTGYFGQTGY